GLRQATSLPRRGVERSRDGPASRPERPGACLSAQFEVCDASKVKVSRPARHGGRPSHGGRLGAGVLLFALVVEPTAAGRRPERLRFFRVEGQDHVQVWRGPETRSVFFFQAKLGVDADGAQKAYNPSNTGLDSNGNAKENGKWVGIALGPHGAPCIQGPNDPA